MPVTVLATLSHFALSFCILQDIKYAVHAHPTLSEVIDELFKAAKVMSRFPVIAGNFVVF